MIKNAENIKEEGNILAKKANETRVDDDQKAIHFLEKLANRKGEVSEQLNQAAKRARQDGNTKNATADFLQFIRRANERGEFSLAEESNAGVNYKNKTQVNESKNEPIGVDEPGGTQAQRQADSLKNDLDDPREAFQEDLELRKDLQRKLEAGATIDEIEQHQAVVRAIAKMYDIPETLDRSVKQIPVESFNNRTYEFKVDDTVEKVVGYSKGLSRLYEHLRKFAWTDDKIAAPANPVSQGKKAVILLGQPAAGKSSVANPIARYLKAIIADSDEAKKILPEYQGGIGANAVHTESALMNNDIIQMALEKGDNIVVPSTGGNLKTVEKVITLLKDKGYDVTIGNVNVTATNAMIRMIRRFIAKGRLIPLAVMKEIGEKPKINYDNVKGKVDGYFELDNNQAFKESQTLLEDSRGFLEPIAIDYKLAGEGGVGVRGIDITRPPAIDQGSIRGPQKDQTPGQLDKDLFDQAARSQPGERQTDLDTIIDEAKTAQKTDLEDPFERGPVSLDQLNKIVTKQYPGRYDVEVNASGGLDVKENLPVNRLVDKIKEESDLALSDPKVYKESSKVEDVVDDLDIEIPDVRIDDATGNEILSTTTPRQIKADIEQDQKMLDSLEACA